MKSFTISMPNKKADSTGSYKNYLLKRLIVSYPELTIDGIDSEESAFSYQYIGPNDRVYFGPSICSNCDVSKGLFYCPFYKGVENYDMATNFERALKKLNDYCKNKYGYKKLYDFKLPDGTPVKEYQNFIQIGYNLIPKDNMYYYLNHLNKKQENTINIFINIINNVDINQFNI